MEYVYVYLKNLNCRFERRETFYRSSKQIEFVSINFREDIDRNYDIASRYIQQAAITMAIDADSTLRHK